MAIKAATLTNDEINYYFTHKLVSNQYVMKEWKLSEPYMAEPNRKHLIMVYYLDMAGKVCTYNVGAATQYRTSFKKAVIAASGYQGDTRIVEQKIEEILAGMYSNSNEAAKAFHILELPGILPVL